MLGQDLRQGLPLHTGQVFLKYYLSLITYNFPLYIPGPSFVPALDLSYFRTYYPTFSPKLYIQTNIKTLYTNLPGLACGVFFLVIPHIYSFLD